LWILLLIKTSIAKYKNYKETSEDEEKNVDNAKIGHIEKEYTDQDLKLSSEQTEKINISQI
jgi:hypothetical protein